MGKLKYLLDTNIISEPLYENSNLQVMHKLKAHQEQFAISVITWHELNFGMERLLHSLKRQKINQYLNNVVQATIPMLPYDEAASIWHAKQRALLEKTGKIPSFVDGQIAAIAKTRELILVTRDLRDFAPFADLAVENWFA